jgi:hypothetical protein
MTITTLVEKGHATWLDGTIFESAHLSRRCASDGMCKQRYYSSCDRQRMKGKLGSVDVILGPGSEGIKLGRSNATVL